MATKAKRVRCKECGGWRTAKPYRLSAKGRAAISKAARRKWAAYRKQKAAAK